uniref:enoyl-CoA hydratase/isomerase family protein n=1 Tax=Salmonella enterica TaxID=28901 RepID=UPI003523B4B1
MSIDLHVEDAIATVTMNNPEALNALDLDHLRSLKSTFDDLSGRGDVRVILLTGA